MSVWSKPGIDYNLSACERYVMTQPIGSIKTLIEIFGKDAFFEMIRKAPDPKNPKYKQLIAQAFASTRLNSEETTVDKFVELLNYDELDFLYDMAENFRETHRLHKLKNLEFRQKQMAQRIHRDLYGSSDNKSGRK